MSLVFLDLRTLSFVLILITSFLSLVLFFLWRIHKTYPGFQFWVVSNLTIAIGFLFLGLRDVIPDFFSIIIGNTLAFGAVLLVFEGNRRFLGLKSLKSFSLNVLILHSAILACFTYLDKNIVIRIIASSIFLTVISILNAISFHRSQPKKRSLIYKFASASYIAFGVLMLMRAILTYSFSSITDLYAPDLIQSVVFLTFIIFAIIWTFNYMILNNERLHNELRTTQVELERLAATDYLTGINNDRRFFEIGSNEFQRARRFQNSLSVIMFDLDYFKHVNDTHGHAAGDKVLVEIAALCRKNLRNIDVIGRLGGEEFAVLLPHTDAHGGKVIAEHLRSIIEENGIELSSGIIKITASFGLTELCSTDQEIKHILDRADTALYEAKRKGRNQIICDTPKKNYKGLAIA